MQVTLLSYIMCIMNIYLSFSFYYFEVHLILVYHVVFILLWFLTEHAPVSLFVLVIEFLFLLFYLFSNNVVWTKQYLIFFLMKSLKLKRNIVSYRLQKNKKYEKQEKNWQELTRSETETIRGGQDQELTRSEANMIRSWQYQELTRSGADKIRSWLDLEWTYYQKLI